MTNTTHISITTTAIGSSVQVTADLSGENLNETLRVFSSLSTVLATEHLTPMEKLIRANQAKDRPQVGSGY